MTNNNENNSSKTILLLDCAGGKSTFCNVLANKFRDHEPFIEFFKESAGSVSETRELKAQEFTVDISSSEKIKYLVIDTAGFGDKILQLLKDLIKFIGNEGINQIFLVSGGRFTKEDIEVYNLLESLLFDENVFKYTTIIRTKFPEFTDEAECERDRQKLRQENSDLSKIFSLCKVVYVDNPPLIGFPSSAAAARESREISNRKLIMHLGTCRGIYKPGNLISLQRRIDNYQIKVEELQEKEELVKKQQREFEQELEKAKSKQKSEIESTRTNFNNQLK